MTTVYAIHAPDADHLADVVGQMRELGAPTIRVVDCGDHFMALEGSHRLAAAHALGLEPILTVIDQDAVIDLADFDWADEANWPEPEYTAGQVAGELFDYRQAQAYEF